MLTATTYAARLVLLAVLFLVLESVANQAVQSLVMQPLRDGGLLVG